MLKSFFFSSWLENVMCVFEDDKDLNRVEDWLQEIRKANTKKWKTILTKENIAPELFISKQAIIDDLSLSVSIGLKNFWFHRDKS